MEECIPFLNNSWERKTLYKQIYIKEKTNLKGEYCNVRVIIICTLVYKEFVGIAKSMNRKPKSRINTGL